MENIVNIDTDVDRPDFSIIDRPDSSIVTSTYEEAQWLEWRRHGIGGTDVAKILGLSDYGGAYEVWLEKTGRAAPFAGNDDTYAGKLLEPVIVNEFIKRHPTWREEARNTIVERGVLRGTIDLIMIDDEGNRVVIDAKAPRVWRAKKWINNDIPSDYFWQLQHYGYLVDAKKVILVSMFDDCRQYEEWHYEQGDYKTMAQMLLSWWEDYIVKDVAPPFTIAPTKNTDDSDATAVVADEEIIKIYNDLVETKTVLSQLEDHKKKLNESIKSVMQNHQELRDASARLLCTWRTHKRAALNKAALEKEYPDIVKKFTVETPVRTFLVK